MIGILSWLNRVNILSLRLAIIAASIYGFEDHRSPLLKLFIFTAVQEIIELFKIVERKFSR